MSYNLLKGECGDDCRVHPFDAICEAPCNATCIDCLRTAGPCGCTCNEMNIATACLTRRANTCQCPPGTTGIALTLRGWGILWDPPTLADAIVAAAHSCPDDPRTFWRFFRSIRDDESGELVSNINCPYNTEGWQQIQVNGQDFLIDPPAPESINDYVIERADAAPNICNDPGIPRHFLLQITDACGNTLALCPFSSGCGDILTCHQNPDIGGNSGSDAAGAPVAPPPPE